MISSLARADYATHARIIILALIAGIVIVLIGISTRGTTAIAHLGEPRSQAPITESGAPPTTPTRPSRRLVETV